MSLSASEVEQAMLALDRSELAALVHRGIQALDPGDTEATQVEIDAAWRAELEQRVDDFLSGKAQTAPFDESIARIRANLAAQNR
ncbi:MAG: addiction module protein [Gulosibacter sp.]|uniref:addiction module protein n=1 Tax=Gulosibacter sp. TaxID=2817531 RepID=UPI003F9096BE